LAAQNYNILIGKTFTDCVKMVGKEAKFVCDPNTVTRVDIAHNDKDEKKMYEDFLFSNGHDCHDFGQDDGLYWSNTYTNKKFNSVKVVTIDKARLYEMYRKSYRPGEGYRQMTDLTDETICKRTG